MGIYQSNKTIKSTPEGGDKVALPLPVSWLPTWSTDRINIPENSKGALDNPIDPPRWPRQLI